MVASIKLDYLSSRNGIEISCYFRFCLVVLQPNKIETLFFLLYLKRERTLYFRTERSKSKCPFDPQYHSVPVSLNRADPINCGKNEILSLD